MPSSGETLFRRWVSGLNFTGAFPLVTKLQLGHALVLEALHPSARVGVERPRPIPADEAELRGRVRSRAGA